MKLIAVISHNNYNSQFCDPWGRRGMHVGYWWESQKERSHWEDQDVGGEQY
jgi:hypothetical protein